MCAGQGAEQRDGGGCCPVAARLDRDEVDGERIARLRALDVEGSRLRVEERELTDHRHEVVRERTGRKAVRPQFENTPGLTRITGAAPRTSRELLELGGRRSLEGGSLFLLSAIVLDAAMRAFECNLPVLVDDPSVARPREQAVRAWRRGPAR